MRLGEVRHSRVSRLPRFPLWLDRCFEMLLRPVARQLWSQCARCARPAAATLHTSRSFASPPTARLASDLTQPPADAHEHQPPTESRPSTGRARPKGKAKTQPKPRKRKELPELNEDDLEESFVRGASTLVQRATHLRERGQGKPHRVHADVHSPHPPWSHRLRSRRPGNQQDEQRLLVDPSAHRAPRPLSRDTVARVESETGAQDPARKGASLAWCRYPLERLRAGQSEFR